MKKYYILLLSLFASLLIYSQPSVDKLIRQGVSLHDRGLYKDAIDCYRKALEINPSSISAIYETSLSYLQLKEYDNAIKYSTRAINANFQPLLMDAYIVKSSALAQTDKLDQSIQLLNEALERCGDSYLLHFNLGLSYFNRMNNRLAIHHLRKAIEIDATHSSAFLLYAYALNDSGKWVQSFYAFQFFLFLEPNTNRSADAFSEMYEILTTQRTENSDDLLSEDGIDRAAIYKLLQKIQPLNNAPEEQYKFFEEASKTIFLTASHMQNDKQGGLLWYFFVPTYEEILESGYFDVYCRYISVAYFPESLEWWNNNSNKEKVDKFIEWFEYGQGYESESGGEDLLEGDDSDLE